MLSLFSLSLQLHYNSFSFVVLNYDYHSIFAQTHCLPLTFFDYIMVIQLISFRNQIEGFSFAFQCSFSHYAIPHQAILLFLSFLFSICYSFERIIKICNWTKSKYSFLPIKQEKVMCTQLCICFAQTTLFRTLFAARPVLVCATFCCTSLNSVILLFRWFVPQFSDQPKSCFAFESVRQCNICCWFFATSSFALLYHGLKQNKLRKYD